MGIHGENSNANSALEVMSLDDDSAPEAANSKQPKDPVTGLGVTGIENPTPIDAVTVLENELPGCG